MITIPARLYSAGSNLPVARIVIHGTVSATKPGGARAVAGYFASARAGGSAHTVVDPSEIIRCAADSTICWHAPPNQHSLGVELCDWVHWSRGAGRTVADVDPFWVGKTRAEFDARWQLPEWDAMLRLAAGLVRTLAHKYTVPIHRVSAGQLVAGQHGITGHSDVSKAWGQTNHTDPGPGFPWDRFMGYVLGVGAYLPPAPNTQPKVPVPVPGVLALDGGLGPATITRWQQVMGTPADGRISRPSSSLVRAVQERLNDRVDAGLVVDGVGIVQDGRTYRTVGALQRYLKTSPDGKLSFPSSLTVKALQGRLNAGRF